MTAEAEVSLMVPKTFLAPDTGTLGLVKLCLGGLRLGRRCLRALRLVIHSSVSLVITRPFLWLCLASSPAFKSAA